MVSLRKDCSMARLIEEATTIQTTGSPPMKIEEFVGRLNTKTDAVSIARMTSPSGWKESGQVCQFDEYVVVLKGILHLGLRDGEIDVREGQAVIVPAGEWVQYSTSSPEGAEYIGICLPAFSPDTVNRDQ
jgi:mannose-6-phosphate isomerase-like protein (cupin superfamily)